MTRPARRRRPAARIEACTGGASPASQSLCGQQRGKATAARLQTGLARVVSPQQRSAPGVALAHTTPRREFFSGMCRHNLHAELPPPRVTPAVSRGRPLHARRPRRALRARSCAAALLRSCGTLALALERGLALDMAFARPSRSARLRSAGQVDGAMSRRLSGDSSTMALGHTLAAAATLHARNAHDDNPRTPRHRLHRRGRGGRGTAQRGARPWAKPARCLPQPTDGRIICSSAPFAALSPAGDRSGTGGSPTVEKASARGFLSLRGH